MRKTAAAIALIAALFGDVAMPPSEGNGSNLSTFVELAH